jgi:hypothetical protein
MKKILVLMIAIGLCALTVPIANAGDDTLVVYMTPAGTATIKVYNATTNPNDQATWHPTAKVGDPEATTGETFYNITNEGTCNVSVKVKATNTDDWTLAGSADLDVFVLKTISPNVTLTTEDQDFVTDLPTAAGAPTVQFGLNLTMPTYTSTNAAQNTTITFTATVLS